MTNRHTAQMLLLAAALLAPSATLANETNKWSLDVSLYGLAVGMSGDLTVKGVPTDLDVGFDEIWDNLEFGAMGKVRIGYKQWALTTEVIYTEGVRIDHGGRDARLSRGGGAPTTHDSDAGR